MKFLIKTGLTVSSLRTTLTRCFSMYSASKNRCNGEAKYVVSRPGNSCSAGVMRRANADMDITTTWVAFVDLDDPVWSLPPILAGTSLVNIKQILSIRICKKGIRRYLVPFLNEMKCEGQYFFSEMLGYAKQSSSRHF